MKRAILSHWPRHAIVCVIACAAPLAHAGKPAPAPLTDAGQRAEAAYAKMLADLRAQIKPSLPVIDPEKQAAFLSAHDAEKPVVTEKKDKNGKVRKTSRGGNYSNSKASLASVEAARPTLADLDRFLTDESLDAKLVKCAVLANATPQGLARFVQQGPAQQKLIDELLGDTALMKQMLYAGGSKAGRYGKTMEILRGIESGSPRSREGVLRRLAIATSLELAAPELSGYKKINPVTRYRFFEKSYLDKELHGDFSKLSTWLYRHVINDPSTEQDMAWMRLMLWNYRPDFINAPAGYRSPYVGLMDSDFGHKSPEWDKDAPTSKHQQTIDRGGQCGPKAFFGRSLGRSFGIPVWGARLRSHTAMNYWTPKGWTQILGAGSHNAFWIADKAEPMQGRIFQLKAMAREYRGEFIKVCRLQWVGDALGEEKVDGMKSGTGGLWQALALNKMRSIVAERHPVGEGRHHVPWAEDTYAEDDPKFPEELMTSPVTDADRKIVTDDRGVITLPAVACTSPAANTDKILFMAGRDGQMQLHYKRWQMPEPFTYEVTVPKPGKYRLSARVVTVNREMFFNLTVNGADQPIRMELPYTVGDWGESEAVMVDLKAGRNSLSFTRTAPEDFVEKGFMFAGPEYGGITVKSFVLRPEGG